MPRNDFLKEMRTILTSPIEKGREVWIADTARVFGRVVLGDECSVWFGAVIRGDADMVRLGARTNVQDNAVIHVDPGFPVHTGEGCTIGHGAIVHGAQLGNNVLVGMHATILNGARIGNDCIIGAGALVTEGTEIPDRSVVLGSPAKVVKQLSDEQMEKVERNSRAYVELAKEYIRHWPV